MFTPLPDHIYQAVRAEGYQARSLRTATSPPPVIPYDPDDAPAYFRAWLRGYQAADADLKRLATASPAG